MFTQGKQNKYQDLGLLVQTQEADICIYLRFSHSPLERERFLSNQELVTISFHRGLDRRFFFYYPLFNVSSNDFKTVECILLLASEGIIYI